MSHANPHCGSITYITGEIKNACTHFRLLAFDALWIGMELSKFFRSILPPHLLLSRLTLKMDAVRTTVNLWGHIPEVKHVYQLRCAKAKSRVCSVRLISVSVELLSLICRTWY